MNLFEILFIVLNLSGGLVLIGYDLMMKKSVYRHDEVYLISGLLFLLSFVLLYLKPQEFLNTQLITYVTYVTIAIYIIDIVMNVSTHHRL